MVTEATDEGRARYGAAAYGARHLGGDGTLTSAREKKTTIFMLMNKGVNKGAVDARQCTQTERGAVVAPVCPSLRAPLTVYVCVWSGDNPLFVFNV